MKKHAILIALVFGQIYIWTGAIFMTILYHLFSFYSEVTVTYITEVFYYIMQAAGIFFYALYVRANAAAARRKDRIIGLLVLVFLTGAVSVYSSDSLVVLLFGAIMNLFIGGLTSAFLTRITTDIAPSERGMAFGVTYATGSIGTYLISLPGGNALTSDYILYVYLAMTAISVAGTVCLKEEAASEESPAQPKPASALPGRYVPVVFLLPILLMTVNTMGYHFEHVNAGEINIVFTRAFYALGLLAAGFINDKSRKSGAVCALLALGFPLISLTLRSDPEFVLIFSIISYIFLGFLSVYRAVLFADIAESASRRSCLSAFGIAGGLLGNAIGTALGLSLEKNQTVLACGILMLYIVCGFLFFLVYHFLYTVEPISVESEEDRQERIFQEFVDRYQFNSKQTEVLRLLLSGCQNCEIAENLYLAESTVKYHVKNILKTTGCANRNELIAAYKSLQSQKPR